MKQSFEWDEVKNQKNQRKHGISFEVATLVFDDPLRIEQQERFVDGEERWQTIGMIHGVLLVLVAHTIRLEDDTEIIRLISARDATKAEIRKYEHG
ncbi:BrnT family toxin [Acinetobacter sp. I-MWF]|uniref:BrnT family toxin n=1 Tax=Acinetobacter TaxID=469 RepID=UPI001EF02F30|nr:MULTISPECIES: BrnT family toxin [unclassified Acinetobacter]MCG7222880.1 BrnT family toxin [Acinetobacter sp. AG3]MCT9976867.1 BrnT family toxin [Acinetobacter sp. I-MWF]